MTFKILVVDDEPESIDFIVSILEDNGYDYITAVDGEEGLRQAGIEKPDLILLDLIMPEKSGILMFQELKKDPETRDIPVIVVSGASRITGVDFGDFKVKQELQEGERAAGEGVKTKFVGPDGFLEKPISPVKLLKMIRGTLKE
jgi:CheY-like chemotaxis protein